MTGKTIAVVGSLVVVTIAALLVRRCHDNAIVTAVESGNPVEVPESPNTTRHKVEGLTAGEPTIRSTPLIHAAAKTNRVELLADLLDRGADIEAINEIGMTTLSVAASERSYECTKYLLEHGATLSTADRARVTPLGWCLRAGTPQTAFLMVSYLGPKDVAMICHAANYELRYRKDDARHILGPILRLAFPQGDLPCEELLGPPLPPVVKAASLLGSIGELNAELTAGGDPNEATKMGFTALMAAVQADDLQRVAMLLANGARVDAREEGGRTALHVAAWRASAQVVVALLDAGADPDALIEPDGQRTPLWLAQRRAERDPSGAEVVEVLLNIGNRAE